MFEKTTRMLGKWITLLRHVWGKGDHAFINPHASDARGLQNVVRLNFAKNDQEKGVPGAEYKVRDIKRQMCEPTAGPITEAWSASTLEHQKSAKAYRTTGSGR